MRQCNKKKNQLYLTKLSVIVFIPAPDVLWAHISFVLACTPRQWILLSRCACKISHSANVSGKTLNCKAPWLCDHRQSMTSYQRCHRAVCAALVNLGQHYLRKEILLWKHQPSPLAASSTNTPRAPGGRWGGSGSREGPGRIGEHGTLERAGRQVQARKLKLLPLASSITRNMVAHRTIVAV